MPKYISTPEDASRFFDIDPSFHIIECKKKPKEIKIILLKIARDGEPKPLAKSKDPIIRKLAFRLSSYISIKSESYDEKFHKEIRKVGSHWFENITATIKEKLLKMARNGEPKPSSTSEDPAIRNLVFNFYRYTKIGGERYDEKFHEEIKRLRPDWFKNSADIVKTKLLEMVRNGELRPSKKSKDLIVKKLASSLTSYIGIKSEIYDEKFHEEIRTIGSRWFG